MKFFDIKNNKVTLDNIFYGIPSIKKIYDEMKDNDLFYKYVDYSILKLYWNTPYKAYSKDIRDEILKKDVFGSSKYKIDSTLKNVMDIVKTFLETPLTRLLDAAENGVEYVINEFEMLKSKSGKTDKVGRPLVSADDVLKWMEKLEKATSALEKVREAVLREQATSDKKVIGQSDIGMYEKPTNVIGESN